MIRRKPKIIVVGNLATSGKANLFLGDNPKRVGLRVQNTGTDNALIYDTDSPVDVNQGWRLQPTDPPLIFDCSTGVPRSALYAGSAGAGGAILRVWEVTEEDTG